MKYVNFKALNLTDTDTNADSAAFDASQIYRLSVQVIVGAGTTMTGSVKIQVSNEEISNFYMNQSAPTEWSDLGTPTSLSAANTNYLISSQEMCYRSFRIAFTGDPANDCPVTVNVMALCV